ncbi:hypothetical protein BH10BAC2_BH10BAC2_27180 [soil metagenome]
MYFSKLICQQQHEFEKLFIVKIPPMITNAPIPIFTGADEIKKQDCMQSCRKTCNTATLISISGKSFLLQSFQSAFR